MWLVLVGWCCLVLVDLVGAGWFDLVWSVVVGLDRLVGFVWFWLVWAVSVAVFGVGWRWLDFVGAG